MKYEYGLENKVRIANNVANGIGYLKYAHNKLEIRDEQSKLIWKKKFEFNIESVEQGLGNFSTVAEQIIVNLENGQKCIYSTTGSLLYSRDNDLYFDNLDEEFVANILYSEDVGSGYYNVSINLNSNQEFELFDTRGMCVYIGNCNYVNFDTVVNENEVFQLKSRDSITVDNVQITEIEPKPCTHIIGDSTLTNQRLPYWSWPQMLQAKTGELCINYAVAARSTSSFELEGRLLNVLKAIKKGDKLIIGFGHNDEKDNYFGTTPNQYIQNISEIIDIVKSKGASAIVVTPIARREFIGSDLIETHGEYLRLLRSNFEVIDLNKFTTNLILNLGFEKSKQLFVHSNLLKTYDNTHTSFYGANLICDFFIESRLASM